MSTDSLAVRDLTSADHDQALAVRTRSFGPLHESMRAWWTSLQDDLVSQHRAIGVFDGDRLVAAAKLRPFEQFWGGRPVPMSGAAGVTVLPEFRGRGVGSLLMRSLAERGVELGDVVSALFPATVTPYRRVGWEIVGGEHRITMDTAQLRRLGSADVRVRAGDVAEVELVRRLQAQAYTRQRASGPKLLTAAEIEQALTEDGAFSYLSDDGYVFYEWHDGDLVVTSLLAATEAAARALWSVVGSGSSIAKRVHAFVGPHDPVHLLLAEEVSHTVQVRRWMLRVLDAGPAIRARGWPEHVRGSAGLRVVDPLLPANTGDWRLELTEHGATLDPHTGTDQPLELGPQGLAALYAGTAVHTLRTAGLAAGGSADAAGAPSARVLLIRTAGPPRAAQRSGSPFAAASPGAYRRLTGVAVRTESRRYGQYA